MKVQDTDFLEDWLNSGVVFSTDPGRLLVAWGRRIWLKQPSSHSKPSFYFPDYFLKDATPWFEHEYFREISVEELLVALSPFVHQNLETYTWHNPYKQLFYESFGALQKKIKSGHLAKAVPFVLESSEKPMSQSQLMKSLNQVLNYIQGNSAYLYGFWDSHEGILGATPEVLFRYGDKGELVTMACAGTRKSTEDQAAFLSDSKERYEHHLVVQGISESLSPYGKVKVGKIQLLNFSQLVHLVTPINIELYNDLLFQEVVDTLHPTPALGAFPKKEGKAWLEDYQQKIPRLRFGAPAGYWFSDKKASSCYVGIRNVQWKGSRMQIAAGCGVVSDSICDREWEEVNLKLKAVKEMLAL